MISQIYQFFVENYWKNPGIVLLLIATTAVLFLFFLCYRFVCTNGKGTSESIDPQNATSHLRFSGKRFPMERRDFLPLLLVTGVYAVVAFWGLGNTSAPEQYYHFDSQHSEVTVHLGNDHDLTSMLFYTGLWTGEYRLAFSSDGNHWTEQTSMSQPYSKLFQWCYAELKDEVATGVRYVRIVAKGTPMELGEVTFYDSAGVRIPAELFTTNQKDGMLLFDEQNLAPDKPSYLNSTYFDEIYHARTAYEHLRNIYPYEISHPPLGKLIIMLGIRLFGMTPFGWRFMGTAFGVLMLPLLYIFLKNMFGKTQVAFCGTILFSFDFMHFVQTRIATIDTYGVFFILLMYYFMYRYMTEDDEAPFRKTALPLLLSGICFGLGAASKWTAIYAGMGLFIFYLIALIQRGRYYASQQKSRELIGFLTETLAFSVFAFIVIPLVIYSLSYLPYAAAKGVPLSWKIIWDNQVFMLGYHRNVNATHPYSSRWWTWLFDARPILYYLSYPADGIKSAFGAFGNPIVWWGGLISMAVMVWKVCKQKSRTALFILIAYLSQIVPWMFISRTTFVYHYFPSALFLVFALANMQYDLLESGSSYGKRAVYGITVSSVVLFALFYPVLTGIPTPIWYSSGFLRWFPSWPF